MKPHHKHEQQLELLRSRGLKVTNENIFMSFLQRNNYYRLRGYFHPFLSGVNPGEQSYFKSGASDQDIIEIVEFDRKLRNLLFEALAIFETQFRASVAYYAGRTDPYVHLNGIGLDIDFRTNPVQGELTGHQLWLNNFEATITKLNSNEIVISHRANEGGLIPIWAAVELMDFGNISRLFRGLDERIATKVASDFHSRASFLKGAVACLNDLRNHVAHHQRIWNNHYPINPPSGKEKLPIDLKYLHTISDYDRHKVFTRLSLLLWLNADDKFCVALKTRLVALLSEFPKNPYIGLSQMGFPEDWKRLELWH